MQIRRSPRKNTSALFESAFCIATFVIGACSDSGEGGSRHETGTEATMKPTAEARRVVVNGRALAPEALTQLETVAGSRVPDGDYWYDARCGACGARGGPTAAFLPPNLALGAPLSADASGGGNGMVTGVFVNGREIHVADYMALSRLGQILPGRYWLEANGNWGIEGVDAPLGNLRQAASANPTGPGYNRTTPGGHLMSDGSSAGWFDPKTGASVLVGG